MGNLNKTLHWMLLGAVLLLSAPAGAEVADAKPFADKKVVLQISDEDAYKQTLVLNVAVGAGHVELAVASVVEHLALGE